MADTIEFLDYGGIQVYDSEIKNYITNKTVQKVTGKDLSSNDYTDADKEKLTSLNQVTEETVTNWGFIKNKVDKYIFIGDSYGEGWLDGVVHNTTSWVEIAAQYLGLRKNVTYWEKSAYGYGFTRKDADKQFHSLLQELDEDIEDKSSITKIVVCGGYNDRVVGMGSAFATMDEGMGLFINYAKANYPNAQIYVGFMGWQKPNGAPMLESQDKYANYYTWDKLGQACSEYRSSAQKLGVTFIEGLQYVMHDYGYFDNDDIHPNQDGQNELGKQVAAYFIGGACSVSGNLQKTLGAGLTFTPNDTYCITAFKNRMYQSRTGNVVTLTYTELGQIRMPALSSGYESAWCTIGTLGKGYLYGHYLSMPNLQFEPLTVTPMGKITVIVSNKTIQTDIRIVHGELQLKFYRNGENIADGTTGFIMPFQVSFNSYYC